MTYQQACSIFGFQMNERLEKKEIKKRFTKLALKYHPDHGGTSEQFQLLQEAHHIMNTHRHDKGDATKKAGGANFHRVNYDDMTNTIHRQTAEKKEHRSFSAQDMAFFIVFFSTASLYYLYRAYSTQKQILKSRWSYTESMVGPEPTGSRSEHSWHPWRADHDTRERMDDIGIIQRSIRREVVEEKRAQAPVVYTPWQRGGPFARGTVVGPPPEVQEDTGESPSTQRGALMQVAENSGEAPLEDAAYWKERYRLSEEKLVAWKEKAKRGVDDLRARVETLTVGLQASEERVAELTQQLLQQSAGCVDGPNERDGPRHSCSATGAAHGKDLVTLGRWCEAAIDAALGCSSEKADLLLARPAAVAVTTTLASPPPTQGDSRDGATKEVSDKKAAADEKLRRRMEQTLRMQTKNLEAVQQESLKLREALERALEEGRRRELLIEQRDSALTSVEMQLEECQRRYAACVEAQQKFGNGPDMEQQDRFRARVEEEVSAMRREFIEREAVLHETHREEMERLIVKQDRELEATRVEAREQIEIAVGEIRRSLSAEQSTRREAEELLYCKMSAGNEELRNTVEEMRARCAKLELALQETTTRLAASSATSQRPGVWAPPSSTRVAGGLAPTGRHVEGSGTVVTDSLGLGTSHPAMELRVRELEAHVERLTEQLWASKQELIEWKMKWEGEGGATKAQLEEQKASYLRAIVVKMLCAKGDKKVLANLLPVLATMLNFDEESLTAIHVANPSWLR